MSCQMSIHVCVLIYFVPAIPISATVYDGADFPLPGAISETRFRGTMSRHIKLYDFLHIGEGGQILH